MRLLFLLLALCVYTHSTAKSESLWDVEFADAETTAGTPSLETGDIVIAAEQANQAFAAGLDVPLNELAAVQRRVLEAIASDRSGFGSPPHDRLIALRSHLDALLDGVHFTEKKSSTAIDQVDAYSLSFDASSYDFGSVAVGGSSDLTATLTNTGTGSVTFKNGYPSIYNSFGAPGAFYISASTCGVGLAPGNSCTLTVTFSPQIAGSPFGDIFVEVNESSDLFSAYLTGTASSAQSYALSFDASSYDFGSVAVGASSSLTAVLTNSGTGAVTFKNGYPSIYNSFGAPGAFYISASTCGVGLAPGNSCTLTVTFSPQIAGSPFGDIFVEVNESSDLFAAYLTGIASQSDVVFRNGFDAQ